MEAQSYGVPVVAPAIGGIPEIVAGDSGTIVAPDAPAAAVAEAILEVARRVAAGESVREASFQSWNSRSNAESNYAAFAATLTALADAGAGIRRPAS
jgi:glycosyltransferase involved in cell wall biosynthesis